jgi:hypothetical protein
VNDPLRNVPTVPPTTPGRKQRHGCLTAWLIFIIVANASATILISASSSQLAQSLAGWEITVDILFGVWTVICAVALFMWKKWGFFGFLGGAVVSMALNLVYGEYFYALTPFISVAILYGVLQIGGPNKGWAQLG